MTWHWSARAGLGAGLLAGSWLALKLPALQRADVRVGDALRQASSPLLDEVVVLTTDLGSVYATAGIAAALAVSGRTQPAADVLGVGAVAWNLAQYSKTRVRRQRPHEAQGVRRLIRPPAGSSFPSGHAAVGLAVMSVLAQAARGPWSRALLYAVGAYVPLSRVYVGVHYPTDVVGGAGMGLVLSALWRGPLAVANRALLAAGVAGLRRALPPLLRLGALGGLRRAGGAARPPPASQPSAASRRGLSGSPLRPRERRTAGYRLQAGRGAATLRG